MAAGEVVADGLLVPEGPVLTADGRVAFVELHRRPGVGLRTGRRRGPGRALRLVERAVRPAAPRSRRRATRPAVGPVVAAAGVARGVHAGVACAPVMDFYYRTAGRPGARSFAGPWPGDPGGQPRSHMDTPVILAAFPRGSDKRTAVAAAADYFYRNRAIAAWFRCSSEHGADDRRGGGLGERAGSGHLDTAAGPAAGTCSCTPKGPATRQRRHQPRAPRGRRAGGGAPCRSSRSVSPGRTPRCLRGASGPRRRAARGSRNRHP